MPDSSMGKEECVQQMMLGQLGIYMQKNEVGLLAHTDSDCGLQCKCQCYTIKPLEESIVLTFMNLD